MFRQAATRGAGLVHPAPTLRTTPGRKLQVGTDAMALPHARLALRRQVAGHPRAEPYPLPTAAVPVANPVRRA